MDTARPLTRTVTIRGIRLINHEGEVLKSFVTKSRDKKAASKYLTKSLKRHGQTEAIVTD